MNRIQLNFKTNQNCNNTNVTGTQQNGSSELIPAFIVIVR